jgi:hypothetical protein
LGSPAQPQAPAPARPESPPVPPVMRHKRYLRNFILDKSLQLRYVLVVTLASLTITAVLGYLIWDQSATASETIISGINSADWIMTEIKQEAARSLHKSDLRFILVMGGACIGLIALLSLFLLVLTHKVAGPLYKVGLYLDKMRDGKLPVVTDLRKGDEFQNFYKKFKVMSATMRQRAEEDVAVIGGFLAACDAANVPATGELGHGLDDLRKLKKDREAAIS